MMALMKGKKLPKEVVTFPKNIKSPPLLATLFKTKGKRGS